MSAQLAASVTENLAPQPAPARVAKRNAPRPRPFAKQYKPRESSPVMTRGLKLETVFAQRIYTSHFDPGASAIFFIVVMMQMLKAPTALIQSTKAELLRLVNEIDNELNEAIAWHDSFIGSKLLDKPDYTSPIEIVSRYHTPLAGRWLSVIQKLDRLLVGIDTVWWGGYEYTDESRLDAIINWQRKVGAIGKAIFTLQKRAREAAPNRQAQEEAKITNHNEAIDHGLANGLDATDLPPKLPPLDVDLIAISGEVDLDSRRGIGSEVRTVDIAA